MTGAPLIAYKDLPNAHFLGARGKVPPLEKALAAVEGVERALGVSIHIVDAAAVCGPGHLASALLHARRAHERGRGRARSLKVEVFLYLAGQRQIGSALDTAGLSPKTTAVGIAVEGTAGKAQRAASELLGALKLKRADKALAPGVKKLARLPAAAPGAGATDFEALAMETTASLDLE